MRGSSALLTISITLLSALTFVDSLTCQAKPMPAPTVEEAARAQTIALAEFVDYRKVSDEPLHEFSCILARYKVVKTLKGSSPGNKSSNEPINVIYCFSDGSGCIPSREWKFSDALMPARGSRWYLFLNKDSQSNVWKQYYNVDAYSTYRGSYGRWEATKANEERVKALTARRGGD